MSNERITKAKPTECPECVGIGYTHKTAPDIRIINERLQTVLDKFGRPRLGSGCPRCLGTGQLA